MNKERKKSFEIHSKENEEISLIAKFTDSSEAISALDELDRIRTVYQIRQSILRIREICDTDDRAIYFPKKGIKLPKAKWLSVAAAASFSKGIPLETVLGNSELDRKTIAAYCTSANNPTSEYLDIVDDSVHINREGIEWLLKLLVKHKQILDV